MADELGAAGWRRRAFMLTVTRIDDAGDPRLADYRDLRDWALRLRRGIFIAESRAVVGRLVASPRFRTRSVLCTAPALEALRPHLAGLGTDIPVYLAPHEVIRGVTGFDFHRGCLAVGERGEEPSATELIAAAGARRVVLLDEVSNPDNVGGIFRTAFAFGVDAMLLSIGTADPLYRKAIRTSMGAALTLPFARVPDWPAGLALLHDAGYTLIALTPGDSAMDLRDIGTRQALPARFGLILGAEGRGLGEASRSQAHLAARIAMASGVDSLNVAVAAAIALHHLSGDHV
jgi:tRNA G18 (ribose-2'-O)-methylase SpoU